MKLKQEVKESKNKFNFDEWVDASPSVKRISANSLGENQLRLIVKKHPKKENMYRISFAFREKIKNMLDNRDKAKIIFFKHKDDDRRLLLTRSENGYFASKAKSCKDYYYFKGNLFSTNKLKIGSFSLDPIFHVKGKNSGSIIEVRISYE